MHYVLSPNRLDILLKTYREDKTVVQVNLTVKNTKGIQMRD